MSTSAKFGASNFIKFQKCKSNHLKQLIIGDLLVWAGTCILMPCSKTGLCVRYYETRTLGSGRKRWSDLYTCQLLIPSLKFLHCAWKLQNVKGMRKPVQVHQLVGRWWVAWWRGTERLLWCRQDPWPGNKKRKEISCIRIQEKLWADVQWFRCPSKSCNRT